MSETNFLLKKKVMSQKQVSDNNKKNCQRKNFLKKTSFHHRNKFLSQLLSEKHTAFTEKRVSVEEKVFYHQQKFLPETKASVTDQVDRSIIFKGIVLSSTRRKCEKS